MPLWHSMGPSLCKLIVGLKPKKLSRLILIKRRKKRAAQEGADPFAGGWKVVGLATKSPCVGAASPSQLSVQEQYDVVTAARHSSYHGSPSRSSGSYIAGRNSDVIPNLPRFSTSSCYERLSIEGGFDLPTLLKLGACSDGSGDLARQGSGTSLAQHRHSTSSSTSSFMSLTSSRLKHVYAQQKDLLMTDLLGNQSHVGELFSGNQFLTHLSAAPAVLSSPCVNSFLRPSHGLVDASMSSREGQPKDRIILFL